MATEQQLIEGIRRADKAGDTAAVQALGKELLRVRAAPAKKPKEKEPSFWQGVGEGITDTAANAASMFERTPMGLPLKIVGMVDDYMGGRPLSPKSGSGNMLRSAREKASAASRYRGSTYGRIAGQIIASAPAMFVPGGGLLQGALGGALMSEDASDDKKLARDAVIGGVVGKTIDIAAPVVGGVVRKVRGVRPHAEPIAEVATRLGVRPAPATTGGVVTGGLQTGLGALPGAGASVANAGRREVADLAAAAARTARELGPVSTPQAAGETLAKGANVYREETKEAGDALYQARNELMGGKGAPVLLASAAREVRDFAAQYPNTPVLGSMMEHPAVRKLATALPEGPEPQLTLSEATDALSHVRGAVRNAERSNTMTDPVKARISKFEQAIEDDVMRAAQASDAIAGRSGYVGATRAQRTADRFWALKKETERGPLKQALKSYGDNVAVSGESVFRAMIADMGRTGGNIKRLRRAWGAMPEEARRTFAATAFEELGQAAPGKSSAIPEFISRAVGVTDDIAEGASASGGNWSFNTFHTNYTKMSPEARKLVFGGKGVDQQIDDIARYASRLKELDAGRNFSNTARTAMAAAYVGIIGNQVLQGDMEGAGKAAVAIPALALAGKGFMASAPGRLWLRNSLRELVSKGGTQGGETALRRLTRQLPVIAENNPAVREEAMTIFRALNDNAGLPLAAGDRKEDQQK